MTHRGSPLRLATTGWASRCGGLIVGLTLGVSLASAEPTYTVQKGDTLWSIAQRFQVSVAELQGANQLPSDTPLKRGRTLIIPQRSAPAENFGANPPPPVEAERSGRYIVQPGDYILKIARKVGISVPELLAANGLEEGTLLKIGQRLIVPAEADKTLPSRVYVSKERVHLRQGPGTRFTSLMKVSRGTPLPVRGKAGQWWRVSTPDGAPAYVAGWVVSPAVSGPSLGSGSDRRASPASPSGPAGKAPQGAGATFPAYVYADASRIHVRQGPGTKYRSRGTVPRGTALRVKAKAGAWLQVKTPNGVEGYVAGWVITQEQPVATSSPENRRQGFILETRVPVRKSPHTDADPLAYVARGNQVWITGESGDWYQVRLESGGTGWVASWKVRTNPLAGGTSSPQRKGNQGVVPSTASPMARSLVRTALSYRGSPYRYGGTTSRGFDCSGLIYVVCRAHGIVLPRTSQAMSKVGKRVPRSQLQPGDLVFFNTNGRRVSHVGMYIGNDRFVHASTRRTGVLVSSLNEDYYRQRYVGARRILR